MKPGKGFKPIPKKGSAGYKAVKKTHMEMKAKAGK